MTIVLGELYCALVDRGVSHEDAQKASHEVLIMRGRPSVIGDDLRFLKWMAFANLVLILVIALKLPF